MKSTKLYHNSKSIRTYNLHRINTFIDEFFLHDYCIKQSINYSISNAMLFQTDNVKI